ncbi:RNA-directed DNA polymerase, eukaryota [Tanacetum coccineum]
MLLEISQLEVGVDKDKCVWSLAHDGVFSVADLRRRINDHILPSLDSKTTWEKSLPRKVNIFMWRLKPGRRPHRLNLSSRAIEIPEISCPSCSGNVESNHHIFFGCDFSKELRHRGRLSSSWIDWLKSPINKEVDIGLDGGRDKPLRPADMLLYSWDGGLDVCVDLTGSSHLTQTGMVNFVPGLAVIDAAQCERGKYMDKCAAIGYGFIPFSFSSLGEHVRPPKCGIYSGHGSWGYHVIIQDSRITSHNKT